MKRQIPPGVPPVPPNVPGKPPGSNSPIGGGGILLTPDTLKCPKCKNEIFGLIGLGKVVGVVKGAQRVMAQVVPVGNGLICWKCGHRLQEKDFTQKAEEN